MKDFSKGYRNGNMIATAVGTNEDGTIKYDRKVYKSVNQAKLANRKTQFPNKS